MTARRPHRFECRCLLLLAALGLALVLLPSGPHAQTAAPPAANDQAADMKDDTPQLFGAVAFTADGSFASAWKWSSKKAVEARVLSQCSKFKRGPCQVATVRNGLCASIANFSEGMASVTYAGAGITPEDARRVALRRCNGDSRSNRNCRIRTTVCSDRKG